jgi:hypothetical protein
VQHEGQAFGRRQRLQHHEQRESNRVRDERLVLGIGAVGRADDTLAVSAATDFMTDRGPAPEVLRQAAVERYTTAFLWAAGIFAVGALVCGSLLRSDVRPVVSHGGAEPAPARS